MDRWLKYIFWVWIVLVLGGTLYVAGGDPDLLPILCINITLYILPPYLYYKYRKASATRPDA